MSKKVLLALAFPLTVSSVLAKTQDIPEALLDRHLIENHEAQYVLKSMRSSLNSFSFKSLIPENWYNLSPSEGAEGVRTEATYLSRGLPQSEDVIVAVIDSGVDVNHEDLQGKVWINTGEIPNDGIDNDGNGYVDDVFGWNFIGGSNGMAKIVNDSSLENGIRLIKGEPAAQVDADTLEVTRELVRMKKLKAKLEQLGESLTPAQAQYLEKVEAAVKEAVDEATSVVNTYTARLNNYKAAESVLRQAGVREMTVAAVRAFETNDPKVNEAKMVMLYFLTNGQNEARLNRVLAYYGDQLKYYYNENFNPRTIVGDNYLNVNERIYGNNDVIGPDSSHGTHVAGIIAAVRNNGIGVNGVATNVKIMAIRVVPNGDERDKDVANGIRYAVDNGAKIINMSFGKSHSPSKGAVDEAVKYAESKGVLLVHAAGNDSKNNDVVPSYPERTYAREGRVFNNWFEIGASSFKRGPTLPASFTNFGSKTVDLFAPGVDINSLIPDNGYAVKSGTSMAAPTAAGVAALLLSYDSALDADGVKALMIDTSRRYPKLRVNLPGTQNQVLFSSLSTYGSIVDAFDAATSLK